MLQVGKILKSNGVDGGLLAGFRDIDIEDIDIKEPVFIYFDGLPVPFFIQSIAKKGTDKAIIFLNDVNSLEDAEELVGMGLFMDESLFEDAEDESLFPDVIGWMVEDSESEIVGVVSDFLDIPANPCLELNTKNGAVIIPLHEDFILEIDPEKRKLKMEIPSGLLNL